MKNYIHPQIHSTTVVMSDGSTYTMRSPLRKDILKLYTDPKSNIVWNKDTNNISTDIIGGQRKKFQRRFKNYSKK